MTKKDQKPMLDLDKEALSEFDLWVEKEKDLLPESVKSVLGNIQILIDSLADQQQKQREMFRQFCRAMGFVPSSEQRKNSGNPIGTDIPATKGRRKNSKESLQDKMDHALNLAEWHSKLIKKHRKQARKIKKQLLKLEEINMDDDILDDDDEKELAAFNQQLRDSVTQNGDPDPVYETPKEAFLVGGAIVKKSEIVEAKVDPSLFQQEDLISTMTECRTRQSFSLNLTTVDVIVEKVSIKDNEGGSKIISASTLDIGPPKMGVTWEFLVNLVQMTCQFGVPFHRLAAMLSTSEKTFYAGSMARMFQYVASRLLPIYLYQFRLLANADILSGDDTGVKVTEVTRYFNSKPTSDSAKGGPPWQSYGTAEDAQQTLMKLLRPGLGPRLAAELGFVADRRDGNGTKKALHTTVLSGRGESSNPRSTIVFYRSHLGSFGNLLTKCLHHRDPANKELIVQSDLSSSNLINDPFLEENFSIQQAGCLSHARRPFAIHEKDDPELAGYMLHLIKGLYIYEKCLDAHGRNEKNILSVRQGFSALLWNDIKEQALEIANKWPKSSALGAGARYILNHDSKLTLYFSNPFLQPNNDFSERMLRMEKLIEANSNFRTCLEGRFALDINRTMLQTAIAAQAPGHAYLLWVLKTLPEKIEANPENYTPLAFFSAN